MTERTHAVTKSRVHRTITDWMRDVMRQRDWTAGYWASLAGIEPSNITRVLHTPEDRNEPIVPNMYTLAKLCAVAGSQPDLLRGGRKGERKPASLVAVTRRPISPLQRRA